MEHHLNESSGGMEATISAEEPLQRYWRTLSSVVKNPKRRFRYTANLTKRSEAEAIRRSNEEKLRIATLVSIRAQQFIGQLVTATTEHFKRLRSYIKGSFASILTLVTAMYMSTLKEQGNPIFLKATVICLFFSLFSNLIVMVLSEGAQTQSRNCFPHQCKDHLYIFIYGSTLMLMLCGYFLLLAVNTNYGPLALFPVLALIIMIRLFLWGCKFGHTQSATIYSEHDGKLKYYSEFSSDGTIATYLGLSTSIFSNPIPRQNGEVKLTENFLYIAAVTNLLLMQLTSVPPAVPHRTMRARVMRAMRYLSYIIVGLLFLIVLLATGAVLQGVISNLIYSAGAMIFVVVIVINELKVQLGARNNPVEEVESDSLAMVVVDFTFGILVNVYSKYVDDRTKVDDHFLLLLVCMLCSCIAFITSLSKVLLVSYGTSPGAWPRVKMIASYISYAFAFVAAVSFYVTL